MPSESLLDGNRRLTRAVHRDTVFEWEEASGALQQNFGDMELRSPAEGEILTKDVDGHTQHYIKQEFDDEKDRFRGLSVHFQRRPLFHVHPDPGAQRSKRYQPAGESKKYRVFAVWELSSESGSIPQELVIEKDGDNHGTIAPAAGIDLPITHVSESQDCFRVPAINGLPWRYKELVYLKARAEDLNLPGWFRDRYLPLVDCIDEMFELGDVQTVGEVADLCDALRHAATEGNLSAEVWDSLHSAISRYLNSVYDGSSDVPLIAVELLVQRAAAARATRRCSSQSDLLPLSRLFSGCP